MFERNWEKESITGRPTEGKAGAERARRRANACYRAGMNEFVPVLLQILVALGIAVGALVTSLVLGQHGRRTRAKDTAYECGLDPEGGAMPRFSVKFYLIAMLFILFDIEVVFFYPWAVVYREMVKTDPTILYAMLSFAGLLFVGYLYARRKGALDWSR
jgi:NADH-quinone oxidoreductase subunit A